MFTEGNVTLDFAFYFGVCGFSFRLRQLMLMSSMLIFIWSITRFYCNAAYDVRETYDIDQLPSGKLS